MFASTNKINGKKFNQVIPVWEQLNLAQQFSVYSLGKFGYVLDKIQQNNLITLTLGNLVASIDFEGDISLYK